MVTEIETDDGTIHQCEECGSTFEDAEEATSHEDSCYVPHSM